MQAREFSAPAADVRGSGDPPARRNAQLAGAREWRPSLQFIGHRPSPEQAFLLGMFRSSSVRSGHVLRAVAVFVSLYVASPSQNHPSALLASSRRVFDAKGLAFQAGGGCNGLIFGSTQWSRPGQVACRGCATCQSWPEHLRLVQRLGCRWVQPHTHDGRASQRSLSLMQRQGGLSACGTSWSVLRSRAVHESRCRPVLNLASSTSFRDDEESKPLSDFEEMRRRREFKVDIDDAEPHKSPELPRGGELEVYMVYTWDGDLMPSGRGFNEDSESDEHSLADGEYAVYNDDGDEAIKFMPWKLSGNTDSWDTYDMDLVDPMSIRFAQSAGFSIPDRYDWNATTSENYRAPPTAGRFFGKYKKVRERMDYSYHVNYVKSRQVLQDEIVTHWREEGTRVGRPWGIFTAGAMGAGKSHTIKMLEAFGCCSLTSMVKVDPDTVKYQLPEMQEYIKRNPGPDPDSNIILAGHATHNESAFLQELIVREMLEENKSMIIDGSLSNAEWYW